MIEEHDADNNPHYDDNDLGDDTFSVVDTDYWFHIAQVGIAFESELVGMR